MALEMDYYTAGRDELTHRVVEPYRLEQRGGPSAGFGVSAQPNGSGEGVHYLAGFCRRAQAAQVFRIDRIQHITTLKSDDAKG